VQLRTLISDHVRPEVAIGPSPVPFLANRLGYVEHDRDGEEIVLFGQLDQRPPRLTLNVRGINDREPRLRQPATGDEVKDRERVRRRRLIVLIVRHEPATEVRGDHLRGSEVRSSERALTRPRRSNQDDETRIGRSILTG